tara:strand:+ start:264 stop:419 length:156 start_codon:yes stop_codon:yes gene_type:complete
MPSYEWIKRMEEVDKLKEQVKILEENILNLQRQLQEAYKRIKDLVDKGTAG